MSNHDAVQAVHTIIQGVDSMLGPTMAQNASQALFTRLQLAGFVQIEEPDGYVVFNLDRYDGASDDFDPDFETALELILDQVWSDIGITGEATGEVTGEVAPATGA